MSGLSIGEKRNELYRQSLLQAPCTVVRRAPWWLPQPYAGPRLTARATRAMICAACRLAEPWAMPTLTRRRSADTHRESWTVYYGDVRLGEQAGVPVDVDQWA